MSNTLLTQLHSLWHSFGGIDSYLGVVENTMNNQDDTREMVEAWQVDTRRACYRGPCASLPITSIN